MAINLNKNRQEEVKVLKWFANFWIYAEIHFRKIKIEGSFIDNKKSKSARVKYLESLSENYLEHNKNEFWATFISISLFQGEYDVDRKKHLFRAEWDTYGDNKFHPQPHWHFYPNSKVESLIMQFEKIVSSKEK